MRFVTDADWTQMAVDRAQVRGDNEVSIVLRRGNAELAAQPVRIAGKGYSANRSQSDGAREVTNMVVVSGGTSFDAAIDDRFTHAGNLYRISFIRPNRRPGVTAEAVIVE